MTRSPKSKPLTPPEDMAFEDALAELEQIIERIEQGEIGLEESLQQRKRGDALIRRCRGILDTAEQELKTVKVSGEQSNSK
ncbi:MAG TPA: exodeoxyribonuclease VII small subunit [Phycisphaerales bacterium]|nr:exodeoxyribonuclease VII small subunit [Phycisphaerales bacterium]